MNGNYFGLFLPTELRFGIVNVFICLAAFYLLNKFEGFSK